MFNSATVAVSYNVGNKNDKTQKVICTFQVLSNPLFSEVTVFHETMKISGSQKCTVSKDAKRRGRAENPDKI